MTVPNDDIVAKLNAAAAQLRQTTQSLGTDYLSRQSVPGPGHVVVGTGAQALGLLPPDQPDGSVLTLDSTHPGGVKWGAGVGGEVDSDAAGNVFEGPGALASRTTGTNNTAVGLAALSSLTTGGSNTALGTQALELSVVDGGNVAVGYWALRNCNGGIQNTAVGYNVGSAITAGFQNTLVGHSAGNVSTGRSNTVVGYHALWDEPTRSYRTAIGYNTDVKANGGVAIGCDSFGNSASVGALDTDVIVLGTVNHKTRIPGIPAFAFGDKYLVVSAVGEIHESALGPAS